MPRMSPSLKPMIPARLHKRAAWSTRSTEKACTSITRTLSIARCPKAYPAPTAFLPTCSASAKTRGERVPPQEHPTPRRRSPVIDREREVDDRTPDCISVAVRRFLPNRIKKRLDGLVAPRVFVRHLLGSRFVQLHFLFGLRLLPSMLVDLCQPIMSLGGVRIHLNACS